jgi:hypothetical protein
VEAQNIRVHMLYLVCSVYKIARDTEAESRGSMLAAEQYKFFCGQWGDSTGF